MIHYLNLNSITMHTTTNANCKRQQTKVEQEWVRMKLERHKPLNQGWDNINRGRNMSMEIWKILLRMTWRCSSEGKVVCGFDMPRYNKQRSYMWQIVRGCGQDGWTSHDETPNLVVIREKTLVNDGRQQMTIKHNGNVLLQWDEAY